MDSDGKTGFLYKRRKIVLALELTIRSTIKLSQNNIENEDYSEGGDLT